jgi:phosphatidylglycerol---prolipoprotein diacylglyceryl transferase
MDDLNAPVRLLVAAVFYGCAYLAGLGLFAWMARRRGFATTGIWIVVQAGLLGGLASAGLVQMAFGGGVPGKTLLGALAGGYLSVVLAKRSLGIRRPTGDAWAVALAGGEAIGRLGCFVAGCCYGKAAGVAWAVVDHGAARHPTQLYLASAAAFVLVVLLTLDRYHLPENSLFYVQGLLLCAFRFGIEFYRDGAPHAGLLSIAQWACIGGFLFFGWRLAHLLAPRFRTVRMHLAPAAT